MNTKTVGDLIRASSDEQLSRMRLFGARFCNVEKCEANTFNCEKCALTFLRQEVDPFLLEMKGFLSEGELDRIQRQIERIDSSVDIVEHDDGSFESVFGGIEAVNNKVNIVDTWRR